MQNRLALWLEMLRKRSDNEVVPLLDTVTEFLKRFEEDEKKKFEAASAESKTRSVPPLHRFTRNS